MGGGDGTVIVHNAVRQTLSDPTVSGRLPIDIKARVVPILLQEDWSWNDKLILTHAFSWAMMNL